MDDQIISEIRALNSKLTDFMVDISTRMGNVETKVVQLDKEKAQLFEFANQSNEAIGNLRGAGKAAMYICTIGAFLIGFLTYQQSNMPSKPPEITKESAK